MPRKTRGRLAAGSIPTPQPLHLRARFLLCKHGLRRGEDQVRRQEGSLRHSVRHTGAGYENSTPGRLQDLPELEFQAPTFQVTGGFLRTDGGQISEQPQDGNCLHLLTQDFLREVSTQDTLERGKMRAVCMGFVRVAPRGGGWKASSQVTDWAQNCWGHLKAGGGGEGPAAVPVRRHIALRPCDVSVLPELLPLCHCRLSTSK